MSKPVRIGFVMEGPTDYIFLRAAIRALLNGQDFELTHIVPDLDENLRARTEGGWGAVYKWCRQVQDQSHGVARNNRVFEDYDIVVIQVDADVAGKKYKNYGIKDAPHNDLPCVRECPPPHDTTDALRGIMLGWLNTTTVPAHTVLCTPSWNMETWVLVALFPEDDTVKKPNVECRRDGEMRLRKYKLIKSGQKLIDKYKDNERNIQSAWPAVRRKCTEAERFSADFLGLVPASSPPHA